MATAQLSEDERKISFDCSVCMEPYNPDISGHIPKLLGCAHTFCTTCLDGLLTNRSIVCPMCRASTVTETAASLHNNFALMEVLSLVVEARSKETLCPQCKKDPRTIYCPECSGGFCDSCSKTVHSVFQSHKPQSWERLSETPSEKPVQKPVRRPIRRRVQKPVQRVQGPIQKSAKKASQRSTAHNSSFARVHYNQNEAVTQVTVVGGAPHRAEGTRKLPRKRCLNGIHGQINGDVYENISGIVQCIIGDVYGHISGVVQSVTGDIYGNVSGVVESVQGDVYGAVSGRIGNVNGDVFGNVSGLVENVSGDFSGSKSGIVQMRF